VPVPGSEIIRDWLNKTAYFLGGGSREGFNHDNYRVTFNGYLKEISTYVTTNPDWVVGRVPEPPKGIILRISPLDNSAQGLGIPQEAYTHYWTEISRSCRYDTVTVRADEDYTGNNAWLEYVGGRIRMRWDGRDVSFRRRNQLHEG